MKCLLSGLLLLTVIGYEAGSAAQNTAPALSSSTQCLHCFQLVARPSGDPAAVVANANISDNQAGRGWPQRREGGATR